MTEEDDQRKSSGGRREYDDPNKALNEHIVANDKRLTRFFRGAIIAFAFIGVLTSVALVGFGVVLKEQQHTADKLAALVKSNQQFAKDIQQQRRDSIRDACVAQKLPVVVHSLGQIGVARLERGPPDVQRALIRCLGLSGPTAVTENASQSV